MKDKMIQLKDGMKKAVKNSSRIALASAALSVPFFANPSEAYSQQIEDVNQVCNYDTSVGQNRICSSYLGLSASGEGVFLKDFFHPLELTPNSQIDLDEMFGFYPQDGGDITYDVIEINRGLGNISSYLRRTGPYSGKNKASIDYVEELQRKIPENNPSSVARLDAAVRDGVIDAREDQLFMNGRWNFREGTYMLVPRSRTVGDQRANTLPTILLNLNPAQEVAYVEEEYARIPEEPMGEPVRLPEREIEEPEAEVVYVDEEEFAALPEEDGTDFRMNFAAMGGKNHHSVAGGSLGFQYGFLGLSVNYMRAYEDQSRVVRAPLPLDREAVGREEQESFSSIGAALEIYPIPMLFAGAGINSWSVENNLYEEIQSFEGETLSVNQQSQLEGGVSYEAFAGLQIPFTDRIWLRVLGGLEQITNEGDEFGDFDEDKRIYFLGIGGSIKVN